MAKKISSRDIFSQEDIFKGIRDSAKQTIKMMNDLQKEVTETANALKKSIGGAKFDSAKAIKNVVDVTQKANKLKKESIQIDKLKKDAMIKEAKALQEIEKIEQQKLKTQSQKMRNDKQERQEKERIAKANARAVKTANDEANAYKKLAKNTRDLKNESKRLGAEMLILEQSGKKNTKAYRDLSNQYRRVTVSAKQGDKALKKLDKSVGDNFRNVGNYKDAIRGLVGVLGTLGAGIGLGQIFRNVTGVMMDFDQAQADLTAISGKTKDELAGLTTQAKDLGATTQFTATQITEMQIELAKLGFTTTEIEASTEAVSKFASATGADMASASKVAGATLRAFQLDASEMERVVSTLGVATTKSALSFSTFETAMSTIAPVASTFGFGVEDTTALLGQLADSGFDASSSATATRNILLNLADANGDLAIALGRPVTNIEELAEGLQELDSRGIDLAETLELTDKRSVAAFNTFIKGSGDLVAFKESITNVNQELTDMAEKKLDSVRGQVTLLGSAWEGFILGINDATGSSETLKNAIGFLARNLSTILGLVIKVVKAFVIYKGTMMAINGVNFLVNGGFKTMMLTIAKLIPGTRAYRLEQIQLARASNQVAVSTTRMGKAMKSVPYLLIIGLAIEFAMALWDGVDASQNLARVEKERAEKAKENKQQASELSQEMMQRYDEELAKLELLSEKEKAGEKNRSKLAKLDEKLAKQKVDLIDKNIEALEKAIKFDDEQIEREAEALDRNIRNGVIRRENADLENFGMVSRLRADQEQARIDIEAFKKLKGTSQDQKNHCRDRKQKQLYNKNQRTKHRAQENKRIYF